MKRLFLCLAVALALPAHAAVTLSSFPPNPGVLPGGGWKFTPGTTFADPPPARAWVNGTYGGVPAAVATDTFALRGPAGALSVAVATSATVPSIAAALARVAARAYGPLSIGMAAYDLLQSSGVRQGAAGAEMDAGTDQVPQNCTGYSVFGGPAPVHCLPAQAACDLRSSYVLANQPGSKRGRLTGSGSTLRCVQETSLDGGLSWNGYSSDLFGNPVTKTGVKMCTPVVDSLTGESYVPGTYSDGKCITGRYASATDSQVAARVTSPVTSDPAKAAKAAVDAGASIDASPPAVSGPASQTGTPVTTTTTSPTGTTSTTTTPTYSYTYQGDTINITTTNTTTTNITNNEGDTTTTTTTDTKPGSDDQGMCTMYPDSLACMKPGTPPTDTPPTPKTVPISIDPVSFGGQGACPPPITFSALGSTYAFPWDPLCDVLVTWVRPVVLVLAAAAAALVFIGGLKS